MVVVKSLAMEDKEGGRPASEWIGNHLVYNMVDPLIYYI